MTFSYEEPVPPMTAADASAALLAYWATLDIDPADIELPDYQSAAAAFEASDAYVTSQGFYLVIVSNTTAAEYAAYVADLQTAGWDCEAYDNDGSTGYACTFGDEGTVPAMEVQDHLASGYIAILAYTSFKMGAVTSQSTIAYIADMIGGDVEDLGDEWYGVEGDYYASSTSIDKIKGWIVNYFTPEGFELMEDWYNDEMASSTVTYTNVQTCVYYNEDADVVLKFTVFSFDYQGTAVNGFVAIAYPGE
jgi:hypothetical protein